jgi:5-methylcytosine-specific restriction endonuclease McrA
MKCTTCKAEKDLTEFHKGANRCKPCAILAAKIWAEKNPDRKRQNARNYVKRHPEKCKTNYQRWRQYNPEHAKLLNRRGSHVRRVRLRGGTGSYSNEEWLNLLRQYDYKCLSCGHEHQETRWGRLTADHVIPISKGGSNTIDNIQPLCAHCNYTKYTNIIDYRGICA